MKKTKILATVIASTMSLGVALSGVASITPIVNKISASAATYSRADGYTYEIDAPLKGSPDTFEAWIKVPTSSKGGTIVGNACNEYSRNTAYRYNTVNWEVTENGYMRVEWDDTATQYEDAYCNHTTSTTDTDARGSNASLAHTFTGTSLKDNKWHHVAVVRTNTAFKYYLDGTLQSTYTVNSEPCVSTDRLVIGADNSGWLGVKTPFNGSIAQVTIYEGAVSEAQIKKDSYINGTYTDLSTAYANTAISQADDVSPSAELMGNWYLGSTWMKEKIVNTCIGGPNASLATCETYVAADMPTADEYDYCFVAIPDVQYMNRQYPDRLKNAMQWIANNKDTYNIEFAMQLGDLSDTGWVEWEYKNAYESMNILTGAGIPWSFVPGNHDYQNNSLYYQDADGVVQSKGGRVTDYLKKWFPVNDTTVTGYYQGSYDVCDGNATGEPNGYIGTVASNYTFSSPFTIPGHSTLPGFGGVYDKDSMENSYYLYDAKGRDGNVVAEYLVMNLEYQPRKSVLRWMNRIIDRYPERRVIITSHNIVCPDGNFLKSITGVTDVTPSEVAFNEAYNVNENVFMTLSGHECTDDIIRRTDYGQNGNKIVSMLIDHQNTRDPKEDTAWKQSNATTGEATGASAVRPYGQDIVAMFFVNEETKEITVRDISPENMAQGKNAAWGVQNQFTYSFADENNPAIGGVKTTVTGTVKNVVNGVVAGANVQVKGTSISAVTSSNGSFTLSGVDASKDLTLVVKKDGYEETITEVTADQLISNAALGDVSLNLPAVETGAFASTGDHFANTSVKITRSLDGIVFKLSGTRALNGLLEMYLNVGKAAAGTALGSSTTTFRFDFTGGGTVSPTSYAYANTTRFNAVGLESTMHYNNATKGYSGELVVPYSWFSQYGLTMNATDDFYIAFSQFIPTATLDGNSGWQAGWIFNGKSIDVASPADYVKVLAGNRLSTV